MKKNIYKLKGVDCAACGLKIEDGVNKLNGVHSSSLNFMLLKFYVTFDEQIVTDEEIETTMHKSLGGFKIIEKNSQEYEDTYQEPKVFKKIPFFGRNKKW